MNVGNENDAVRDAKDQRTVVEPGEEASEGPVEQESGEDSLPTEERPRSQKVGRPGVTSRAAERRIIALDLGASSGRAILGELGDSLKLSEAHRFPNGPVSDGKRMRWNFDRLWQAVRDGIVAAAKAADGPVSSVGVDTWGVDYGLLGPDGNLLEPPVHYRDPRTNGVMEKVFKIVPRREIFEITGLQFIQLNTLFQLYAEVQSRSGLLDRAKTLLMMPDIFNYLMTGVAKAEFTDVSTTQAYDPRNKDWACPLLRRLGIPTHMLPEIIPPGTVLGPMKRSLVKELGLGDLTVIAPGCHDTASAVAAVPASGGKGWAYLSSGTWSLIGAEVRKPVITDEALDCNFTNEGGIDGTFRFLKNISGLWLLQETQRIWRERDRADYPYEQIIAMANEAKPFVSWVDPDDPSFLNPQDMPEAIRSYCRRTNQPVPGDQRALVRLIFESLALKYRAVFDMLKRLHGDVRVLHIVGGGSANALLNQFTANALGVQVLAGPMEATAIGNVLVQAKALGDLGSLDDIRAVVRKSFPIREFEPQNTAAWEEAYGRWQHVTRRRA